MMDKLRKILNQYNDNSGQIPSKFDELARDLSYSIKEAAKAGSRKKVSRKQLRKSLDKARSNYKELKKELQLLEDERAAIEAKVNDCRDRMFQSRSDMLSANKVIQNMDLADCNYVMMYNGDEISYLLGRDKAEHHVEVNKDGEVNAIPWKEYKKKLREMSGDIDSMADEIEELENEELEDIDDEEDSYDEEPEEDDTEDEEENEPDGNDEEEEENDSNDCDAPPFRFMDYELWR